MHVLEKILEEIELEKKRLVFYPDCSSAFSAVQIRTIEKIEQIICKYMSIRNHMNDGWVSVEERLPMRTFDEKINESYQKYLVFIDGVDGWDIDIAVYDFWNDKKWREAHDGYGEIENVNAWRPLPEPYRPERSDNHDGEGSNKNI